ncbi:phage exclusion protein Lit family protein [Winogradskyella vidalii]|uniref:phage exclusion protein Lit family protein n=1 Tax=Winogradskyella vidalii TaxID=2615024 RepID=UPI0015CCD3CE|nr:phage exclusion protein Lit family protein [Winogradskyella vidalii]
MNKRNWYNPVYHKGTQPIRVLSENIILWFENSYPNFTEEVKNELEYNGLKNKIDYLIGENRIQEIAYIDSKKTITIEESFLSYLWIIGYVIFVNYDEVVAKHNDNKSTEEIIKSLNYVLDSESLFDYGMSLTKSYKKWDKNKLPNPEYYDKQSNSYIEKMNGVFLSAINFIMIHEFAHLVLGHVDLDNQKNTFTEQEYKEHELAADKYAIESLLESDFNKTNIHIIRGGILAGLISLTLLDNTMEGDTHPDPDHRVRLALEMFSLKDTDPLWGVACMGFKQWSRFYKKDLDWPKKVENWKELFYLTMNKLTEIKNYS